MGRYERGPFVRESLRIQVIGMARESLLDWLAYFDRHARSPAYVQQRGLRREVWSYGQVLDTAHRFARELEARKIRDRKSTRLNSSHIQKSRMPSSA